MSNKEESLAKAGKSTAKDKEFDKIVGHIEDIVVSDNFQGLRDEFMEQHCHHFEDVEENKFIYTEIFHHYVEAIEKHLETELASRIPGFSLPSFLESMTTRRNEISEELLELLLSFSDFCVFKEMLIEFNKSRKDTSEMEDSNWLVITSYNAN